jgi:hypothetical protein
VDVTKTDQIGNSFVKSLLVAGGHRQLAGIDYQEVFAPVVRGQTIRFLLAIGTLLDLEIRQIDFDTVFFNSTLSDDVYMSQPKMFDDGSNRVSKLLRGIYGLAQSPREWFKTLSLFLISKLECLPTQLSLSIENNIEAGL